MRELSGSVRQEGGAILGSLVAATALASAILANAAVAGPWAKRRVYSSFIDKVGPNRHGPARPVLPGPAWMLVKIWAVFLFTQWARMTLPRVRIDQLIQIGWKFLLVAALGNLLLTAGLVAII